MTSHHEYIPLHDVHERHVVALVVEALRYNRKVAGSIPDGVTGFFH
jgi:hypothetical protein